MVSVLALSLMGAQERRVSSPITIERVDLPDVPLRYWVARVDVSDPRVRLRAVPGGDEGQLKEGSWPTVLEPVPKVAEREGFALAVNGDFFDAERVTNAEGATATTRYTTGRRARPLGVTVTDGKAWSKPAARQRSVAVLWVDRDGKVAITPTREPPQGAFQAISGNHLLLRAGDVLPLSPTATTQTVRHPRTAAGLSADGKTLILLALDGRSYSSRGASMRELAELMKQLGAHDAINLDGGGSTTMVRRERGETTVLNTPSDGRPRPVANVLGVVVE